MYYSEPVFPAYQLLPTQALKVMEQIQYLINSRSLNILKTEIILRI